MSTTATFLAKLRDDLGGALVKRFPEVQSFPEEYASLLHLMVEIDAAEKVFSTTVPQDANSDVKEGSRNLAEAILSLGEEGALSFEPLHCHATIDGLRLMALRGFVRAARHVRLTTNEALAQSLPRSTVLPDEIASSSYQRRLLNEYGYVLCREANEVSDNLDAPRKKLYLLSQEILDAEPSDDDF